MSSERKPLREGKTAKDKLKKNARYAESLEKQRHKRKPKHQ
ncbi:hypothetical protein AAUPMC_20086 [Pasteurella multocida subsp. multocida str. Anand1_cattle]|nr:hypothetical protein AAUPMC_20086 [Pasteurella multocida subsp. multocida str. Anand1_cattle]